MARKRYVVMMKNDLGGAREIGNYANEQKAQREVKIAEMEYRNDVMWGYADLHW